MLLRACLVSPHYAAIAVNFSRERTTHAEHTHIVLTVWPTLFGFGAQKSNVAPSSTRQHAGRSLTAKVTAAAPRLATASTSLRWSPSFKGG